MFDPANRMQQQLAESLLTGESRQAYLLLDPMLADLLENLRPEHSECQVFTIPLGRDDIPEERYPRLVKLHPHAVEVVHASLELALAEQAVPDVERDLGFGIGGWLTSDMEPEVLVRHLSACMRQMQPGSSATRYVRWADRRVFEWMWMALDADNRARLLGPIMSWWTLDRCGKLVDHNVELSTYRSFPLVRFSLQASHWADAAFCELVQAVLRGWRQFAPQLPPDYLSKAAQAAKGARNLGLVDIPEIVLVSAYALQIHPRLAEHPRVRELVRQSREQSRPLMDVLAEVPDPQGWNAIRDELDGAGHTGDSIYRSSRHG
ncbi:DUF4123 domain-containing protein [Dyella acidiphila]|uniref:DUF4123 domain-containing protein n=1 Tax=Dyella acidiphila TaxID=2775866 RepID=A0ABR9GAQ8_9GAMM|nr:DUF4123 domain-containing protein [Dyella acidiphila]MBE1161104.1 DUF4123 domain-containing protein [Dyella acidiphila]